MKTLVLLLAGAWLCAGHVIGEESYSRQHYIDLARACYPQSTIPGSPFQVWGAWLAQTLQERGDVAYTDPHGPITVAVAVGQWMGVSPAQELVTPPMYAERVARLVAMLETENARLIAAQKAKEARRAGYYSGIVAAGGPARLFQDQLRAEQGEGDTARELRLMREELERQRQEEEMKANAENFRRFNGLFR